MLSLFQIYWKKKNLDTPKSEILWILSFSAIGWIFFFQVIELFHIMLIHITLGILMGTMICTTFKVLLKLEEHSGEGGTHLACLC